MLVTLVSNILSIVPLLPVYPGGPTTQWANSKKQRKNGLKCNLRDVDFKKSYEILLPPPMRGGSTPRGGTLIFSHIPRLWLFFGVQNSEFQYFLGFEKNEYFWGV